MSRKREGWGADRAIPSVSTDSDIFSRSRDTPGAFAEVFERHAASVAAFIRRRVGADVVEDVLSETFLVAFRRRADFDTSWESARPWLLGIASRVLKKHRADEARHWRAVAASAGGDVSSEGGIEGAGTRLDAAAAVRGLAPRIAALSERDRETLLLYAWGGLTQEEVAAVLGVPVGTVGSRLNRVRRKLAPPGSRSAARLTWMGKEESDGRSGARA
jgi:RNA polymerase sigma factor (sigma-70 family)